MPCDGAETLPTSPRPRETRSARLWPLLRQIGRTALLAYLVVVGAAMFLENSLIYFPVVYPEGDWNPRGLRFEDAWFQAADGTRLHGWYVPQAERPGGGALLPRQRRQPHASRRRPA